MLEKFPGKKTKKLDESPSTTPQSKLVKRSAATGEPPSSPENGTSLTLSETNSIKNQKPPHGPTRSFLDHLLESTVASELSEMEKQALHQCQSTEPANSAGLTVRQRINLAKKKNGNQKKKGGQKTKEDDAKSNKKKDNNGKKDTSYKKGSNGSEKKSGDQEGGEDPAPMKKLKKKKKAKGSKGNPDAQERAATATEAASEEQVPTKKRPHSHSEEDLASMDRARARQIVTSRAYHAALAKNIVTKTKARTMNPAEVQRLNDAAKKVARDAGKEAGAMFDEQRPRNQ